MHAVNPTVFVLKSDVLKNAANYDSRRLNAKNSINVEQMHLKPVKLLSI